MFLDGQMDNKKNENLQFLASVFGKPTSPSEGLCLGVLLLSFDHLSDKSDTVPSSSSAHVFFRARFCCNLDFPVFMLCILRVCEAGSEVDSGLHRTWTHRWMGGTVGSRTPRTTHCSTCRSAGVISTASSLMVSVKLIYE